MSPPKKGKTNEERLAGFLKDRALESTEEAPLRVFRVHHDAPGGKPRTVLEVAFHGEFDHAEEAEKFLEHLQGDANTTGSDQVYVLRAFYGFKDEALQSSGGRWSVRLKPILESEEGDDESIGNVTEGVLLAQAHRHIQGVQGAAWQTIGGLVGQVTQMAQAVVGGMTSMMQQMTASEAARMASDERTRLALDNKAVRELEVRKELKKDERIDGALRMLTAYLPVYLADKSSSPGTALEMVVDNMSDVQIENFMVVLDHNQRQAFLQILKSKAQRQAQLQGREAELEAKVKEFASSATSANQPAPDGGSEKVQSESGNAQSAPPAYVEKTPAYVENLKEVLKSLDPEQLAKIAAILEPKQTMAIGDAMFQMKAEEDAEKRAKRSLCRGISGESPKQAFPSLWARYRRGLASICRAIIASSAPPFRMGP